MAYRLPSERVPIEIGDTRVGDFEAIGAWPIRATALRLTAAFVAAKPEGQFGALTELYRFFVEEAQPTWDIADHRGPIPATAAGMLRLPLPLAFSMIYGWSVEQEAAEEEPEGTAVDAIVPPGPARDELNRRLKAARKAA